MQLKGSCVIVFLLALGACVSPAGVPVPSATPFDASPAERAEYLKCYRAGYEAVLTGYLSSRCQRDEYWRVRSAGWVDGQGEGYLVWAEEYEVAVERGDRKRLLAMLSGLGDAAAAEVNIILAEKPDIDPEPVDVQR